MNNYNTTRPALILKEYGRNMQMLIEHIKTFEDKELRTESAYVLVDLMKLINPVPRDAQESGQKLWDDLYIMSDFDLEIDGPFPKPEKELLYKKPNRLGYVTGDIRFKHYGRNIQLLILEAIKLEDPEEREGAIIHIGRLMKSFQNTWNKDNVEDVTIIKNIETLSKGALTIDLERVKSESLFDSMIKDRRMANPVQQSGNVSNGNNNNNNNSNRPSNKNNNRRNNNNSGGRRRRN
ncbi:MAG: DUF4290 domain-containing protein [Cyclobacteriaceae bacterium]|nr:DUF4290 domain-containing protein [Cyclobacteriaceae bacterium]